MADDKNVNAATDDIAERTEGVAASNAFGVDIKAIMDVANHPNMTVCWNSNREDLNGKGLKHNFDLVKDRFGDTVHVREMNMGKYPYAELMKYFVQMDYKGWILLECRTRPSDPIAALKEQKKVFRQLLASAKG